jgi:hypothetical protein
MTGSPPHKPAPERPESVCVTCEISKLAPPAPSDVNSDRRAQKTFRILALALLIGAFTILHFGRTFDSGFNHDEHQFLAPGALLAREGLLPYRDYPIFHVANLTFAYAAVASVTKFYILGAKAFSVGCAAIGLALICTIAVRRAEPNGAVGFLVAVAVTILVFFDPLFAHASGKTWNHDAPAVCMIVALIATTANYSRQSVTLSLVAGLAIGLAAGTRLTSLPLVVPITLAPLVYPIPSKRKFILLLSSGTGALVGLGPTLWLACLAPEQFYFDNFRFPRLRLVDPNDVRAHKTVTWWRKGRFFIKEIVMPSAPLFAASAFFVLRSARSWIRERGAVHFPNALIVAMIPFVLIGCFAPSRYQYQHYYAFVCLLALGIAYGANASPWKTHARRGSALALPVIASLGMQWDPGAKDQYAWIREIARPERWFPVRAHRIAQQIRGHVATGGKVLTLAPAWPIEAGLRIYPEFASGPFAWRSAPYLAPEQRRKFRMIAPSDLPALLENDAPAAILTGFEDRPLEKPLFQFAERHGYQPVELGKGRQLWVAPR